MGATSGIGMEIAKLCIAAGWRVGIAGRRAEPLEKLRMSAPSQVVAGCIDITRESWLKNWAVWIYIAMYRVSERKTRLSIPLSSCGRWRPMSWGLPA